MPEQGGADTSGKGDGQQDPNHQFNARLYHLIYGLAISLAFTVADFAFLWPESHFFALLFLAAVLSLLAIYEMAVVYQLDPKWMAGTVAIIFVAAGISYKVIGPNPPNETETHGWLVSANEPTPGPVCKGDVVPADPFIVFAGNMRFMIQPTNNELRLVAIGQCKSFSIVRSPEGIAVDSEIFDQSGNLVLRIENNEFHAVSGKISYTKRPDRSTLAVYDQKGAELLWVHSINSRAVWVRGVFTCPGYAPVSITDEAIAGMPLTGAGCVTAPAIILIR